MEMIDDRRVRLYVDLSDPRDVEGLISDLRAARSAWVKREEAAIERARRDEEDRNLDTTEDPADVAARIEARAVGADFNAGDEPEERTDA